MKSRNLKYSPSVVWASKVSRGPTCKIEWMLIPLISLIPGKGEGKAGGGGTSGCPHHCCVLLPDGPGTCCRDWLSWTQIWPGVCLADAWMQGERHPERGQRRPLLSMILSIFLNGTLLCLFQFSFPLVQSKSCAVVAQAACASCPALQRDPRLYAPLLSPSFLLQHPGEKRSARPGTFHPIPGPEVRTEQAQPDQRSPSLGTLGCGNSMGASVPPPARQSWPAGAATIARAPAAAPCAKAPRRPSPRSGRPAA